ncbi:MAG: hypothetical protein WAW61_18670, partial [Methylococcaceae bacterium]
MAEEEIPQGFCRSCRKPWNEILSAKADYGVFEQEGIEYTYHTVGSGVTKYNCVTFKTEADWLKKRSSPGFASPSSDDLFDRHIADLEKDAFLTLKSAGLPTVAGEDEPHLNEQGRRNRLLQVLEDRGYREHVDKEWYAAVILCRCAFIRDFIADGANIKLLALYSILFGGFIREAEIRFGYIKNQSKTGGDTRGKRQTANRESEWAKWQ